jgi:hypothetical protein
MTKARTVGPGAKESSMGLYKDQLRIECALHRVGLEFLSTWEVDAPGAARHPSHLFVLSGL